MSAGAEHHARDVFAWADKLRDERDYARRLFNRLDAAISHHKAAAGEFTDTHDDALYAARDRVLRDYARGEG